MVSARFPHGFSAVSTWFCHGSGDELEQLFRCVNPSLANVDLRGPGRNESLATGVDQPKHVLFLFHERETLLPTRFLRLPFLAGGSGGEADPWRPLS